MAPQSPRIGTRIRRARERKRLSQADLAGRLGVSRSAVNAWENDRAWPQNSIGALEEILGITLDEPEQAPRLPGTLDEDVARLPLDDETKELVIETIEQALRGRPRGPSVSGEVPSG